MSAQAAAQAVLGIVQCTVYLHSTQIWQMQVAKYNRDLYKAKADIPFLNIILKNSRNAYVAKVKDSNALIKRQPYDGTRKPSTLLLTLHSGVERLFCPIKCFCENLIGI